MSKRVPFGPAVSVRNVKNEATGTVEKQEVPRTIAFATAIKPENAPHLPKNAGGKVMLELSPAAIQVIEFESADEVRNAAGEHLDSFLLSAANAAAKSQVRAKITAGASKVELPPTNVDTWAQSLIAGITEASIFEPAQVGRTSKADAIKSRIISIQDRASEMSKEDILAALLELAAA